LKTSCIYSINLEDFKLSLSVAISCSSSMFPPFFFSLRVYPLVSTLFLLEIHSFKLNSLRKRLESRYRRIGKRLLYLYDRVDLYLSTISVNWTHSTIRYFAFTFIWSIFSTRVWVIKLGCEAWLLNERLTDHTARNIDQKCSWKEIQFLSALSTSSFSLTLNISKGSCTSGRCCVSYWLVSSCIFLSSASLWKSNYW
jgi:hypothetical protein